MNNSVIHKLLNGLNDKYSFVDKATNITKAGECETRQMTDEEKQKYGEPTAAKKNKTYGMWPRAKKGA